MNKVSERMDLSHPINESLYKLLRNRVMIGVLAPGQILTLRGIAKEFNISVMPVRDAVRRLVSEGAFSMSKAGRVATPILNYERIEELFSLRALLEPELASQALPRLHNALLDRLATINESIEKMILERDAIGYVRTNIEFHRTLYLRAQAPATLALVETIWLQLSPSMRVLYERTHHSQAHEFHEKILVALRNEDEPGLRYALKNDVTNGLKMLVN